MPLRCNVTKLRLSYGRLKILDTSRNNLSVTFRNMVQITVLLKVFNTQTHIDKLQLARSRHHKDNFAVNLCCAKMQHFDWLNWSHNFQ